MTAFLKTALAAAVILAAAAGNASAYFDVFPRSSFDTLSADDVAPLDCETLWLARNEIYARNDYRFKTARGQAVFGTDGQQDAVHLAGVEWANVALIKKFEQIHACS
jgi:hypothetical protein